MALVTHVSASRSEAHCNPEDFEIAASEFDALTGSLLRVRNVSSTARIELSF